MYMFTSVLSRINSHITSLFLAATPSGLFIDTESQSLNTFRSNLPPAAWGIGSQLHSSNDLREWVAWLNKGHRSFKIDFHLSNSKPTNSSMFLLSHDTPLNTSSYNTSSELLELLASPDVVARTHPNDVITIALCFKDNPVFCAPDGSISPEAGPLIKAIDSFFEQANAVAARAKNSTGLTITFVLDGSVIPFGCERSPQNPNSESAHF